MISKEEYVKQICCKCGDPITNNSAAMDNIDRALSDFKQLEIDEQAPIEDLKYVCPTCAWIEDQIK